jgi:CRP-like cAMP-binding protein
MANALVELLRQFRNIPQEDEKLISLAAQHRHYKEGAVLFKGGKICRELFFICKGVLRIMVIDNNGNEVTHFFLKENQFCSILNSFTNQIIAYESILAACDAEVLAISRAALDKLYLELPYLNALINQITNQALIDKIAIRNAYLGQDSARRYKIFLARQPEIAARVPLSNIASYLEVTPQSLSRIRKNIR